MKYPLLIEDEPHLCRLIRDIARAVARETPPRLRPIMTKQDCYRETKSRTMTDRAIQTGSLKVRIKEGREVIMRKDFENWIEKAK